MHLKNLATIEWLQFGLTEKQIHANRIQIYINIKNCCEKVWNLRHAIRKTAVRSLITEEMNEFFSLEPLYHTFQYLSLEVRGIMSTS